MAKINVFRPTALTMQLGCKLYTCFYIFIRDFSQKQNAYHSFFFCLLLSFCCVTGTKGKKAHRTHTQTFDRVALWTVKCVSEWLTINNFVVWWEWDKTTHGSVSRLLNRQVSSPVLFFGRRSILLIEVNDRMKDV